MWQGWQALGITRMQQLSCIRGDAATGLEQSVHVGCEALLLARRIHKQAWASKGDVYHLLFDICWFIYGNTWPREDSILVYLLFALIQHTTGACPSNVRLLHCRCFGGCDHRRSVSLLRASADTVAGPDHAICSAGRARVPPSD